jgi:fibronectin type 3 domain-containing protein
MAYVEDEFTGATAGSYQVQGKSERYYLADLDGDSTPAIPPATDSLASDPTTLLSGSDEDVAIPESADGSGALCYTVGGLTGSSAGVLAGIESSLWVRMTVPTGQTRIRSRIVVDLDGDLDPYGTPDPGEDVIYETSAYVNALPGSYTEIDRADFSSVGAPLGDASTQDMIGGKVVVRIWRDAGSASGVLRLRSPGTAELSSVRIPYSFDNSTFVMGDVAPSVVRSGQPATLVFTVRNLSNVNIGLTRFRIPANSGGAGTPWTVSATPTTRPGAVVSYLNPSGTTDGWVEVNWASSPVTAKTDVPVTLVLSPASSENGTWGFDYTLVQNTLGGSEYSESSDNDVRTLGAPSSPASFSAAPMDHASSGGRIRVTWDVVPSSDQACNGYILERRSPAGSGVFGDPVTIEPNSVGSHDDAPVSNMVSYQYRIVAKNVVAQSSPVTSSPVTAFVNLTAPTGLAAYSGGASVSLVWNAVTAGASNFPLDHYEVYRGTATTVYGPTPVATPSTAAWIDGSVSDGTRYYYVVRAVDAAHQVSDPVDFHESPESSWTQGYPPGNPPTGLGGTYDAGTTTIGLSWSAPVSNINAVAGYVVYRGVSAAPVTTGVPWTVVGPSPASLTDSDSISFGDFYTYLVAAVDSMGVTSNRSSQVTVYVRPSAPSGVTATGYAASVTLSWQAVTMQGVTQYRVYRDSVPVTTLSGGEAVSAWGDPATAPGMDYDYFVTSVNTGGESEHSVTVTGARLPTSPAALSALSGPSRNVTLSWSTSAELNVTGVDLSRNTVNSLTGATVLETGYSAPPPYEDTGLSAGTTYFYFLQYRNPGGLSSPAPVAALMVPPTSPVGLSAVPSGVAVTLSWTANAPSENVTQYRIYRSTTPDPFLTGPVVATPVAPPWSDTTAARGSTYYYAMVAVNGGAYPGGMSAPSVPVTVAVPPGVPASRSALSGLSTTSYAVTVAWSPVSGQGVTAYAVHRAEAASGPYALLAMVATPGTGWLDDTTADATVYHYVVNSVANGVESVWDATGNVAVTAHRRPNTPGVPVATAGNSFIALSWAPAAMTSYPVALYEVFRSTSLPVPTAVPIASNASAAVTDTGAANNTVYYYVVRAADSEGHVGAATAPVSEMAVAPPGAPSTLRATDGDEQILLDWGPAPAGSRAVSVYVIQRSALPTGPFTAAATVSAAQRWYLDTDPGAADTYYYTVTAVDDSGFTSGTHRGASSVTVSASTNVVNVNPPTGLAASSSAATIVHLSWTAPVTYGKVLSGIQVFRASSSDGPWTTPLATAAPGALSFDDTTAQADTTYYYVVRSVEQGTGTPSGDSNVAGVTTPSSRRLPPVGSGQAALDANLVRASSGGRLGVHFRLAAEADVEIHVYNVTGDLVAEIHYGRAPAGRALRAEWDLKDRFGSLVSSGGYLVEVSAGAMHQVLKVAVLR